MTKCPHPAEANVNLLKLSDRNKHEAPHRTLHIFLRLAIQVREHLND